MYIYSQAHIYAGKITQTHVLCDFFTATEITLIYLTLSRRTVIDNIANSTHPERESNSVFVGFRSLKLVIVKIIYKALFL